MSVGGSENLQDAMRILKLANDSPDRMRPSSEQRRRCCHLIAFCLVGMFMNIDHLQRVGLMQEIFEHLMQVLQRPLGRGTLAGDK